MRSTFFGLLTVVTFFSGVIHAAEPLPTADTRAALYQREVRAALTKHLWRITQDDAGKLTAERLMLHAGGTSGVIGGNNQFAHLAINFRADGKHHTVSTAAASLYIYEQRESTEVGILIFPPLALRDPKLTQEYLDILAEAESRLAAGHPAFAATGKPGFGTSGDSNRVAMK